MPWGHRSVPGTAPPAARPVSRQIRPLGRFVGGTREAGTRRGRRTRTLPLTLGAPGHTPGWGGVFAFAPTSSTEEAGGGELANVHTSKSQADDHTCHFGSECSALIRPLRRQSFSAGTPAQGHPEKTGIKCSSLHVKCFISSA